MEGVLICVVLYSILVFVAGVTIATGIFVFHVAVVPLIFKYSKTFRRSLVFANFVQWPPQIDHRDPSSCGIEGARNLYLNHISKVDDCEIKIGVWHVLPKSVYDKLKSVLENNPNELEVNEILDKELADSTKPVVIYCHGNSNSRAATHRIKLYKFFQQMDFHTIAFDYRGYGDSTNVSPSEHGVVEDALKVLLWVQSHTKAPIVVWGHSLGTGISSHLLGNLEELSKKYDINDKMISPKCLILEAPFNNLADEVANHPLSRLVTWLPYYEATFVSPFRSETEFSFKSDQYLSSRKDLPILILHAKDDVIVPFTVGYKLYKTVLESRKNGGATIKLHAYEKKENLGHKYICDADNLKSIVGDFVNDHL